MFNRLISIVIGSVALLHGPFLVSAQEGAPSPSKKQDRQPIRYEAEEGIP
jgi:hypothetical protein